MHREMDGREGNDEMTTLPLKSTAPTGALQDKAARLAESFRNARWLAQNVLIAEDKVEGLLDKFKVRGTLRTHCREILKLKTAIWRRICTYDYTVISLGCDCLPALFASRWALRPVLDSSAKRLPFDLGMHRGSAPFDLLFSDFSEYAKQNAIGTYERTSETGSVRCFKLNKYAVYFNHDPVDKYFGSVDNFTKTLNEWADNFRNIVSKKQVLFIYNKHQNDSLQNTIDNFTIYLSQCHLQHYLLILSYHDDDGEKFEKINDTIFILKHKSLQCSGNTLQKKFSHESCEFEKNISNRIASIIEEHFPEKKETHLCTLEEFSQKNDKKIIHEIAEEYNIKEYLTELRVCIQSSDAGRAPDGNKTVGAIVMNCNPFTLGHRYLIEYASRKVNLLIIFVVEEDLSQFSFADRCSLIRAGTADLSNVVVVRSGKFSISTVTLPGYFTKDDPDLAKFDASSDMDFFGTYIAPALGITVRFVGTEPICPITDAYNRQMLAILPRYGVRVVEIPRWEVAGEPVSASRVRECLRTKDWATIKRITPPDTYTYLRALTPGTFCA